MSQADRVSEVHAEDLLGELLTSQGWNSRPPARGDLLRQQANNGLRHLAKAFKGESRAWWRWAWPAQGGLGLEGSLEPVAGPEAAECFGAPRRGRCGPGRAGPQQRAVGPRRPLEPLVDWGNVRMEAGEPAALALSGDETRDGVSRSRSTKDGRRLDIECHRLRSERRAVT